MTGTAPIERDGVRISDVSLGDTEAYVVEPVDGGRGAAKDRAGFLGRHLGWADG